MQNFISFDPLPTPFGGPKPVHVLFDESHSESWSISLERAGEFNPSDPLNSSYQTAAQLLTARDCSCYRNPDRPLLSQSLELFDLLILLHPCDPEWERTTSPTSPQLTTEEIESIQLFVESGGSLLVVSEYENGKYRNNLNALLLRWGIQIENNTVQDRLHSIHDNHAWILSQASTGTEAKSISTGVNQACFYQAGSCTVSKEAEIVRQSHDSADPSLAGLIAVAKPGKGRVAIVTDSRLFGDEFIDAFNHQTLWLNLIHWLSIPAYLRHEWKNPKEAQESTLTEENQAKQKAWISLKTSINDLRLLQAPEGSIEEKNHALALPLIDLIVAAIPPLALYFSHQSDYLSAFVLDLQRWKNQAFIKPDFKESLEQFQPQKNRIEGIEHLAIFPMYTPNASLQIRFEAILFRTPWPEWIATLEKTRFTNPKFVPGELIDYTDGYHSDCAVLFPETVSITGKPMNRFGTIFCDREAKQLLHYSNQAVELLQINLPPRALAF